MRNIEFVLGDESKKQKQIQSNDIYDRETTMSLHRGIDFEKALNKGKKTYDSKVGDWWLAQCGNGSHQAAYRKIVERLREAFGRTPPRSIVEYACGPGHLLTRLAIRFPKSRIIGIDGSTQMLDMARRRLRRIGRGASDRVELHQTHLPDFSLPKWRADAVVFAFPNVCPSPDDQPYYDRHGSRNKRDRPVAKRLARAREEDPEMETVFDKPEAVMTSLLDSKVISRNLRGLVKRGGYCLRAEYGNASLDELTDLVRMRLDFEAGSMSRAFQGKRPEAIFKRSKTTYHRSKVIEDVYHQTGDEDDKSGGYFLSLLRAI
jgi:SAM-dependent methyltransferase